MTYRLLQKPAAVAVVHSYRQIRPAMLRINCSHSWRRSYTILTNVKRARACVCVCVCARARAQMVGLDETTKEIKHLEAISTFSPVGSR